jgi:fatty acid desaturase
MSADEENVQTSPVTSDYVQLRQQLKEAGLFEKHQAFPIAHFVVVCMLMGASVTVVFVTDRLWVQLLNAALMAFAFGQLCFVFHDAGHHQIFSKAIYNTIAGYTCTLLLGSSFRWWRDQHNTHHKYPNHEDLDPDVSIPFLAFSEAQALGKRGLQRWIVRYQAAILFPLWTLTALHMRLVTQVRYFFTHQFSKVWPDALLFLVHMALYFGLLFSQLPPVTAILFIVVHQLCWGFYLASVFAPNHYGMEMFAGDDRPDFLHMQILGSRNLRGHPMTDLWYGGLNYQIEHHLFPTLQRSKLPRARKIVEQFCRERGIRHYETGVFASYLEIYRHMRSIARFAQT